MATLKLYKKRLEQNFKWLDQNLNQSQADWGVVTKLLCGHEAFLSELMELDIKQVHDSRLENLELIKSIRPDIETILIRPPSLSEVSNTIRHADISFVTQIETVAAISKEARKQGKNHKLIVPVEMGDLREGVLVDNLPGFLREVLNYPHIQLYGIGTNFHCLNGVIPTDQALTNLSLIKKSLEKELDIKIPFLSGGSSVCLPQVLKTSDTSSNSNFYSNLKNKQSVDHAVNHVRIGETLFFGSNIIEQDVFQGMRDDVFELEAEIIELKRKPRLPSGPRMETPSGEIPEFNMNHSNQESSTHIRAILDVGLLDIDPKFMTPKNNSQGEIIGASSDMLVVDLGHQNQGHQIGDVLNFRLDYMGVLGLMNSNYIHKKVV